MPKRSFGALYLPASLLRHALLMKPVVKRSDGQIENPEKEIGKGLIYFMPGDFTFLLTAREVTPAAIPFILGASTGFLRFKHALVQLAASTRL